MGEVAAGRLRVYVQHVSVIYPVCPLGQKMIIAPVKSLVVWLQFKTIYNLQL